MREPVHHPAPSHRAKVSTIRVSFVRTKEMGAMHSAPQHGSAVTQRNGPQSLLRGLF